MLNLGFVADDTRAGWMLVLSGTHEVAISAVG